jgi:hypothetical protein
MEGRGQTWALQVPDNEVTELVPSYKVGRFSIIRTVPLPPKHARTYARTHTHTLK